MATVLPSRAAILLQHQANPTHRPLIRSHRLARPPCPSWLRSRQPRRDAGLRRARKGRPPNPNSPHRSCPRPTAWEEHRMGEEVRIINEKDFYIASSPLPFSGVSSLQEQLRSRLEARKRSVEESESAVAESQQHSELRSSVQVSSSKGIYAFIIALLIPFPK